MSRGAGNRLCVICDLKNQTMSKRESQAAGKGGQGHHDAGDPKVKDLL